MHYLPVGIDNIHATLCPQSNFLPEEMEYYHCTTAENESQHKTSLVYMFLTVLIDNLHRNEALKQTSG